VVCSWWFVVNFSSTKLLFMPTVQKFEELEVWQLARVLSQKVYPLTYQEPISKDFRFKDQIRGSCGSIMDNIAEGFERGSKLEFINSLTIAKGEAGELKSQLYRGLDNRYFTPSEFEEIYELANKLTKMLTSFINYLNRSTIKGQKYKERR
jgi:four helix bundle protein